MLPRTPRGGLPKRRDRMPPAAMRPTSIGSPLLRTWKTGTCNLTGFASYTAVSPASLFIAERR